MTDASPTSHPPLSAAAEETLAGLEASVEASGRRPDDPLGWLSAVIDDHPEALSVPGEEPSLEAVQAAVHETGEAEGQSQSLTRAEIVFRAGQRAQNQGRPIVSSQDILRAVLILVVERLLATAEPAEGTPPTRVEAQPERQPDPPDEEPDPLPASMAAEEMLQDLSRRLGIGEMESASIFRWLDLLLSHYPVSVGGEEGTGKLQKLRDWGNGLLALEKPTPSFSAQQVRSTSAVSAREAGRPLLTPQDVAIAIVKSAAEVRATAEIESAEKGDPAIRPGETSALPIEERPERVFEPEMEPENAESTWEAETQDTELEPIPTVPAAGETPSPLDPSSKRAPPTQDRTRTFRLFVSSTFQDLQAERNALQKIAFPRLERFCARHGARFQAIDLRWGVSEEAGIDQQTMNICLGEIERCRQVTPRPNFLVLLGDRYGWLPPPPQIPAEEFEEILDRVDVPEDRDRLERWYRKDLNADPPEYQLQPRSGEREEFRDWKVWNPEEVGLREILGRSVGQDGLNLPMGRRKIYQASATEQEVLAGALEVPDPGEKVVCFFRRIQNYPKDERGNPLKRPAANEKERPEKWPEFFVSEHSADRDRLQRLKLRLTDHLHGPSILNRQVEWTDDGLELTKAYLDEVAKWVGETLEKAILRELEHPAEVHDGKAQVPDTLQPDAALSAEVRQHQSFAEERRRFFVGCEDLLAAIAEYVSGRGPVPLAVMGDGGSGKSALMAEAARRAESAGYEGVLVTRFVGATPGSSEGRFLLDSLCREISLQYGTDPGEMPTEFQDLVPKFAEQLRLASAERPLVLFLDSLDQLREPALGLAWIPSPLPPHARLVVSARPNEMRDRLRNRGADFLELGPLSRKDGERLLEAWLGATRPPRRLQPAQTDAVLDAFTNSDGNPLYLKLAAEEARRWPAWAEVGGETPTELPAPELAEGVQEIIRENLFGRLTDEDNHGSVLVSRAVGYLAASRFGLAEDELIQLLSRDPDVYTWFLQGAQHMPQDLVDRVSAHWFDAPPEGVEGSTDAPEPEALAVAKLRELQKDPDRLRAFLKDELVLAELQLPVVLWSRLFFDLEPYLTERQAEGGNLLSFYHRELGDVADEEFLTSGTKEVIHGRLADYFRSQADPEGTSVWDGEDVRGLSELPYHLTHARRWEEVFETLTDFSFLEQKAARVGIVERTGSGGKKDVLYTGVFQLQDDFDRALEKMPGGEGGKKDPHPLIVTAVNFGKGLVVRCPWCNTEHPLIRDWLGKGISCPNEECGGPLKVNTFTVGDDASA